MSFVNPGDQQAGAETLPDPCATFDCGEHGHCLAMNMTPTCVCEVGYVAIASGEDERRDITCVVPSVPIEAEFYERTLPDPTRLWSKTGAADSGTTSSSAAGSGTTSSSTDDSKTGDSGQGASCALVPGPKRSLPPWWFGLACAGVWMGCFRRAAAFDEHAG